MFENLTKKLQGFSTVAMKKTGEVAEIAALKTKVITKKRDVARVYRDLGKAYYEANKDAPVEYADKIDAINTLYADIDKLETEMKERKEKMAKAGEIAAPVTEETTVQEAVDVVEAAVEEVIAEADPVIEEVAQEAADLVAEVVEEVTCETEQAETVTEAAAEVVEETTEEIPAEEE